MNDIAKTIMIAGMVLVICGVVIMLAGKIPGVGKLPGDILIKKEHFTFYFPLATCVLLSVIFSFFMYLFGRK